MEFVEKYNTNGHSGALTFKAIIMKILLLLLLPVMGYSQEKKSNKIIAHVNDSSKALFGKLVTELFDMGFTLENKDQALGIISTNERPSKKYGATSKIRARITDSTIVFSSVIALDFEPSLLGSRITKSFTEVSYIGSKRSPMRECWDELNALALKFSNNITYSK